MHGFYIFCEGNAACNLCETRLIINQCNQLSPGHLYLMSTVCVTCLSISLLRDWPVTIIWAVCCSGVMNLCYEWSQVTFRHSGRHCSTPDLWSHTLSSLPEISRDMINALCLQTLGWTQEAQCLQRWQTVPGVEGAKLGSPSSVWLSPTSTCSLTAHTSTSLVIKKILKIILN